MRRFVSRSAKAHILLILVTFVWGATFVQIKAALDYSSPLMFNVVRMTIASCALCLMFRKQLKTLSRKAIWSGAGVGIFLWLGYELQTTGLTSTAASKSAFLTGIAVVLVPIFMAVFFRRHISGWTAVGAGVALSGLYLLSVPAGVSGVRVFSSMNRGDLLTIACAVCFAFQIILMGRSTRKYPFQQIATVQIVACAALMVVSVPLVEKPHITFNWTMVLALAVTSILATAIAFSVQAWAQQFTPPTHAALIFSLEPVFAWITSLLVLHEQLDMRSSLGAGMILGGVLLSELKGSSEAATENEIGEGNAGKKDVRRTVGVQSTEAGLREAVRR